MSYAQQPLNKEHFLAKKRDKLLSHNHYAAQLRRNIYSFDLVTISLLDISAIKLLSADRPMIAARRRAWNAVSYLNLQYSAGEEIAALRNFLPTSVQYWQEYSNFHKAFHNSPDSTYIVAHMTLGDDGYWDAVRLTSLAVLLGCTRELAGLCEIWDYGDQPLDGLLERLIAPYVTGRASPLGKCTRHLPYFKLLKVFAAEPSKRPALMAKYMDDWYEASRREPYYRSHTQGRDHSYLGYWSFEAAAVTIVLDIDDSSYRDKDFYPKDLADFARRTGARGTDLRPRDQLAVNN